MTPQEALTLVEVLAAGRDPATGAELPEASPFNQPRVIRALYVATQAMAHWAERQSRPGPGQAGKPWRPEEDARLAAAYDGGTEVAALASAHQRTEGAIRSRLVRLGRLEPTGRERLRPGSLGVTPRRPAREEVA
jgi:hypothetical protein